MSYPSERLKGGLNNTRQNLLFRIKEVLGFHKVVSDELVNSLEEVLIEGDVGVEFASKVICQLKERVKRERIVDQNDVIGILKNQMILAFDATSGKNSPIIKSPWIIMVVGVNGTGKTTTIAKLASRYKKQNKKVLLAACDTFRAAAIDQLAIWADRVGVGIVKSTPGTDPAAVAFDAVNAAVSRNMDVLIADTAGRLHTKSNLMEELAKMKRVMNKALSGSPDEVLLVLDATVGQNALSQVKLFNQAVELTGIVLAKLDGTAKGGIAAAIADRFKIPIKYVGIGERIEDLEEFDAKDFVEAIFQ